MDVLWASFLKIANKHEGKGGIRENEASCKQFPEAQLTAILNSDPANALLDLDPPLETILADQHERLEPDETANAIRQVREKRNDDPRTAMLAYVQILKAARGLLASLCGRVIPLLPLSASRNRERRAIRPLTSKARD